MLPFAALDRLFNRVCCRSVRDQNKSIAEVLVDVSAHESIHLMATEAKGRRLAATKPQQKQLSGSMILVGEKSFPLSLIPHQREYVNAVALQHDSRAAL